MKIRKSIDHFTGKEQSALLRIRNAITDTIQPELLFFLNSQAFTSLRRDYLMKDRRTENFHLSCTLLAIVPEQQDEGLIATLETQLLSFGKVNLIVYPMERFVLELQNKTFFLPTIYRHAILLFELEKGCFQEALRLIYPPSSNVSVSPNQEHLPEIEPINNPHPLSSYTFYPHCLDREEIENPFIVLFNFFVMVHLPEALREIDVWMDTISKGLNERRHGASYLLTLYEAINKLIHAAFLIRQMDDDRPANLFGILKPDNNHVPETKYYAAEGSKDTWSLFPRSLSKEQFINPYLVFRPFFEFWSLAEWKEELHNMLHLSFSDSTLEDTGEVVDLLNVKSHLDKLVEACHLILVREPEITERCRTKQTAGA